MSDEISIVLSPKAQRRLEEYAEYLYEKTQSNKLVANKIGKIEAYLDNILTLFPESGTLMPEYGDGVRHLSYQGFSVLYRVIGNEVEILTFYKQNLP